MGSSIPGFLIKEFFVFARRWRHSSSRNVRHERREQFGPLFLGRRKRSSTMFALIAIDNPQPFATRARRARGPLLHAEKGEQSREPGKQMEQRPAQTRSERTRVAPA